MTKPAASQLIDTHCHLDDALFNDDRDEVIERAGVRGVSHIIVPGISRSGWSAIRALGESNPQIHTNYGIHPLFLKSHAESDLTLLSELLSRDAGAVGVGECGLDYFHKETDRSRQQFFFTAQLHIAKEQNLPVVIHARRAVEDVILGIRESGHYRGMVHSFNGSYEQATRLIDLGYRFSFGGAVTHQRATRLRKLIARLPLDSMMLETDAPYQADAGLEPGARTEPSRVVNVLEAISVIRSESVEQIASQTTENAVKLFSLDSGA